MKNTQDNAEATRTGGDDDAEEDEMPRLGMGFFSQPGGGAETAAALLAAGDNAAPELKAGLPSRLHETIESINADRTRESEGTPDLGMGFFTSGTGAGGVGADNGAAATVTDAGSTTTDATSVAADSGRASSGPSRGGSSARTGEELCASRLARFATLLSSVRNSGGRQRQQDGAKLESLLSSAANVTYPSLLRPDLSTPLTVGLDGVGAVPDKLLENVMSSFGASLAQCAGESGDAPRLAEAVKTTDAVATFSVEGCGDASDSPKFTKYGSDPLVLSVNLNLEVAIDLVLPPASGSASPSSSSRTATLHARTSGTATGAYTSAPPPGAGPPPLQAVDVKLDLARLESAMEAEARRVADQLLSAALGGLGVEQSPSQGDAARAGAPAAVSVATGSASRSTSDDTDKGSSVLPLAGNDKDRAAAAATAAEAEPRERRRSSLVSCGDDHKDDDEHNFEPTPLPLRDSEDRHMTDIQGLLALRTEAADLMQHMSDMTTYSLSGESDDDHDEPSLEPIAEHRAGGAKDGSEKEAANEASLDDALSYLSIGDTCPLCIVVLNAATGRAVKANAMFVKHFGPVYKFAGFDFATVATDDDEKQQENKEEKEDPPAPTNRGKFRDAIGTVRDGASPSARARNVQMLTLAGEAGLPRRRYFDWTIGSGSEGSRGGRVVILYGDPCSPEDETIRHRDAELIDFFQNAPIALHWLSGEGIVLWANQTELNVLGYTAEEYIGQPIMKFCPDEEELVLEIFKTLGSGNIIKDVPVRFRTKEGKIVHLLIDSNVAYNVDGSFGHTRCFIRDDTQRKVRDARSSLLLEEMRRSLRMLDGFMSRTLHHVMQPLHSFQLTCDVVSERIRQQHHPDLDENVKLLTAAGEEISSTVRMVRDVADLNRFDQGASMQVEPRAVNLRDIGTEALAAAPSPPTSTGAELEVAIYLDLQGGGAESITTDPTVLLRVLGHLLDNAIRVTKEGRVTLRIGYPFVEQESNRVTFAIEDTGPGLPIASKDGGAIFQRYHNEVLPQEGDGTDTTGLDYDDINDARSRIEDRITSRKQDGMGIGLPLSHHLVSTLGGDLRHQTEAGQGTEFWFTLPIDINQESGMGISSGELLQSETIEKDLSVSLQNTMVGDAGRAFQQSAFATVATEGKEIDSEEPVRKESKRRRPGPSEFVESEDITDHPLKASDVAGQGVSVMMLPSVLVVEDSDVCANLLSTQLRKFNCSTARAENGQEALDILSASYSGMFNLVLMDLRMPVMDGLQCTRKLKKDSHVMGIPIVALTGDLGESTKEECKEIGFSGFYTKPLHMDTLGEILEEHCGYVVPGE